MWSFALLFCVSGQLEFWTTKTATEEENAPTASSAGEQHETVAEHLAKLRRRRQEKPQPFQMPSGSEPTMADQMQKQQAYELAAALGAMAAALTETPEVLYGFYVDVAGTIPHCKIPAAQACWVTPRSSVLKCCDSYRTEYVECGICVMGYCVEECGSKRMRIGSELCTRCVSAAMKYSKKNTGPQEIVPTPPPTYNAHKVPRSARALLMNLPAHGEGRSEAINIELHNVAERATVNEGVDKAKFVQDVTWAAEHTPGAGAFVAHFFTSGAVRAKIPPCKLPEVPKCWRSIKGVSFDNPDSLAECCTYGKPYFEQCTVCVLEICVEECWEKGEIPNSDMCIRCRQVLDIYAAGGSREIEDTRRGNTKSINELTRMSDGNMQLLPGGEPPLPPGQDVSVISS